MGNVKVAGQTGVQTVRTPQYREWPCCLVLYKLCTQLPPSPLTTQHPNSLQLEAHTHAHTPQTSARAPGAACTWTPSPAAARPQAHAVRCCQHSGTQLLDQHVAMKQHTRSHSLPHNHTSTACDAHLTIHTCTARLHSNLATAAATTTWHTTRRHPCRAPGQPCGAANAMSDCWATQCHTATTQAPERHRQAVPFQLPASVPRPGHRHSTQGHHLAAAVGGLRLYTRAPTGRSSRSTAHACQPTSAPWCCTASTCCTAAAQLPCPCPTPKATAAAQTLPLIFCRMRLPWGVPRRLGRKGLMASTRSWCTAPLLMVSALWTT